MTARRLLPWERVEDSSPLAARVAAEAARGIVERRYESGMLLTEANIARDLGASRTPAREAMLQLEAWGLVRLLPKKGAVVSSVTFEARRDLLVMRTLLEAEAVRSIGIEDVDLQQLAADLQGFLEDQRNALSSGDRLAFASADFGFHARIIQSARNSVFDETLQTLAPRLARLTYLVALENPRLLPTLIEEHKELAEHARSGDRDRFVSLVQAHIEVGHFRVPATA